MELSHQNSTIDKTYVRPHDIRIKMLLLFVVVVVVVVVVVCFCFCFVFFVFLFVFFFCFFFCFFFFFFVFFLGGGVFYFNLTFSFRCFVAVAKVRHAYINNAFVSNVEQDYNG